MNRTWAEKRLLVQLLVDIKQTKRETDRKEKDVSRREKSAYNHLLQDDDKVRVGKKMFLNTLSIGEWSVLNWAKNKFNSSSQEAGTSNQADAPTNNKSDE